VAAVALVVVATSLRMRFAEATGALKREFEHEP